MVGAVWALPAKVILVSSILGGANLLTAFIAVTLSSIRLMPMVAALVPEIRTEKTPTWLLLFLSHFVAITAWVFAMERVQAVPREHRVRVLRRLRHHACRRQHGSGGRRLSIRGGISAHRRRLPVLPDAGLFPGVDLEFGPFIR